MVLNTIYQHVISPISNMLSYPFTPSKKANNPESCSNEQSTSWETLRIASGVITGLYSYFIALASHSYLHHAYQAVTSSTLLHKIISPYTYGSYAQSAYSGLQTVGKYCPTAHKVIVVGSTTFLVVSSSYVAYQTYRTYKYRVKQSEPVELTEFRKKPTKID